MSNNKDDLGKGIRSLLQDIDQDINQKRPILDNIKTVNAVNTVSLDKIEVNPFQPRSDFDDKNLEELARSIKTHGLIQPITLRKLSGEKYQLIVGERRLRASKMAGLKEINAYIRTANSQEMLELALIENIQREDLNAIEISINYKRLLDECRLSHEELGERVGKDRTTVTNYLRLLKLPAEIQFGLKNKLIHMGHARTLINIEDEAFQLKMYNAIISKGLSVRMVEKLVKKRKSLNLPGKQLNTKSTISFSGKLAVVRDNLRKQFGVNVNLKQKKDGQGEIIIPFSSDEDLNRLLSLLENE